MVAVVPNRYAIFLDIAGRVTEDITGNEFLTTAGVALLPDTIDALRSAIPHGFPKWSDSNRDAALDAVRLISGTAVVGLTLRIRKEPVAWKRFWEDARTYQQKVSQADRCSAGFLRAANVIKYRLFCECAARVAGETVRRLGAPTVTDASGLSAIDLTIVCDSDIQGAENISVFKDLWTAGESKLLAQIGLARYTRSVQLATEQQEPLLLLPDHLAGATHAFLAPTGVDRPRAIMADDLRVIQSAYQALLNVAPPVDTVFNIQHADVFGTALLGKTTG